MANKSIICQILDGFGNIHIFSVSETHLSTESEAKAQIEGYTKSRASGQDGGFYISSSILFLRKSMDWIISPKIAQRRCLLLTTPMTFLINLSLETGDVPSEWKVTKVTPPVQIRVSG